jgi:DNA-binding LytR/AlgR family response regulator
VWTAFGLFFGTQDYIRDVYFGNKASLPGYLVSWLLCGYSWGILTVPILRFLRRFPLPALGWSRFLLIHLPSAAVFASVQLALYTLIASAISALSGPESRPLTEFYSRLFVREFRTSFLVYLAVILAVTTVKRIVTPDPVEKHIDVPVNGNGNGKGYAKRISVKDNGRIVLVDVLEIDRIESYGNYLFLHTANKRHIVRETMSAMEQKLDPEQFVRIRRSAIVRIDRIEELRPYQNGEYHVVLQGGVRLSSTRRYRKNMESVIRS